MSNLITVAEYEDYDQLVSPVDAQTEADITAAISNATAYIEQETGGRTFKIADLSPSGDEAAEVVNGRGQIRIYTKNGPVASVSKLEYWDGDEWQEITYNEHEYTFKPNSHVIYFQDGMKFHSGYQNWRITYSYGYDTSFPQELKYAAYVMAKHFYNETNRQGIATQQDGEQNWNYTHKIPDSAITIIHKYRYFV